MLSRFVRLLAFGLLCLPLAGLGDAVAQQGQKKATPKDGQQVSPPRPGATGSDQAGATNYPTRPVRVLVGFAAGGAVDTIARLMGQTLSERLGQPFVVENRPGAAGSIASQAFVRAAPDGYTVYLTNSGNAIIPALSRSLPFDFIRDTEPVGAFIRTPNVMVLGQVVTTKSVAGFMNHARSNPDRVVWGSGGIGSMGHLSGELFKLTSGVKITHVPFPGTGPALQAVLGGQAHVMFDNVLALLPQIRAGTVRPVAVTTAARVGALADVPTVGETLQGYEASGFYGMSVPKGTPREIIARLNREINAALSDQKIQATLTTYAAILIPGKPEDFGKIIADDTAKWARVVTSSGITPQ